jgi:type IX secretion system PorP/SprF family membrane protein
MKRVKIIFVLALALASGMSCAQQAVQYSQYMNNNYVLNPAAGGTEDYVDIKASFRRQWLGIIGSPKTYYLTVHSPIAKFRGKPNPIRDKYRNFSALGGTLFSDATGPISRMGAYVSYGYNMSLTKLFRVSVAASVGVQQYTLDGTQLIWHDTGDEIGIQRGFVPDATLGVWAYNTHMYFGASATQLTQQKLPYNLPPSQKTGPFQRLANHYYITGGVRIPMYYDFTLIPSIMIKYNTPAPVSVDLNVKLKYQDLLWAGVSYRNLDSFVGMAGVTINKWIDIGYAYDATVSRLAPYANGTHEILVGVRLKPRSQLICPSNFW